MYTRIFTRHLFHYYSAVYPILVTPALSVRLGDINGVVTIWGEHVEWTGGTGRMKLKWHVLY